MPWAGCNGFLLLNALHDPLGAMATADLCMLPVPVSAKPAHKTYLTANE